METLHNKRLVSFMQHRLTNFNQAQHSCKNNPLFFKSKTFGIKPFWQCLHAMPPLPKMYIRESASWHKHAVSIKACMKHQVQLGQVQLGKSC